MIEILFDFRLYITIIVLYVIYKLGFWGQNLEERFGYRGPSLLPYFGNMMSFGKEGIHSFDRRCCEKYGLIYPIYIGAMKMLVVRDEEALKQITTKNFQSFMDRASMEFGKDSRNFITRLKGKDWERVRNIISPTFTSGKLKKMSSLIEQSVDLLIEKLNSLNSDESVDLNEIFGALTMDVISRTMFGIEIDSQKNPNNQFVVNAKKLFTFSGFQPLIMLIKIFPSITKIFKSLENNVSLLDRDSLKFFKETVKSVIQQRKNSKEEFNDFLALILEREDEKGDDIDHCDNTVHKPEASSDLTDCVTNKKKLSIEEIVAQCTILLIGGYHTTAITLTFASYFMAMNPAMQEEVYNEIINTIGKDGPITYEALQKMVLLDAAISETLRMCPPIPAINRCCNQNTIITTSDGRALNFMEGDTIWIPVYAIHKDEKLWPDPEKYDLHRFDFDKKAERSLYSYMPFGIGPRNCVAMRFALLEVKWALAAVLRDFQLNRCEKTVETLKFKLKGLTAPIEPILLNLIKRR